MTFTPKEWADGAAGNTPITASELNRIEAGIEDAHDAVDAIPAPLAIGTTASTAAAGNHTHAAPTVAGVTGLQAALDAKGTSNLALGTTATTALKGDTVIPAAAAAGSAAQLTAGTDTVQRTWSAKMLTDEINARVAAAISEIPAG